MLTSCLIVTLPPKPPPLPPCRSLQDYRPRLPLSVLSRSRRAPVPQRVPMRGQPLQLETRHGVRAASRWIIKHRHQLCCSSAHGRLRGREGAYTSTASRAPSSCQPQFNVAFLHHYAWPTLAVAAEVFGTRSRYHTHRDGLTVRGHARTYVLHPEHGFSVTSSHLGLVVIPRPSCASAVGLEL
jgi:hypothetical protein